MSEKVRSMFASIADNYDATNTTLSLGIHHRWRKLAVAESGVQQGMTVLDCATGTGDLAIEFKQHVGKTGIVIGSDFCAEMLEHAPSKAKKQGLDIHFEIADAMNLPYKDNSFDIVSIAFGIRNVDDPVQSLREMARVLKPGGKAIILEFGQPKGWFAPIFRFYSKTILPIIGGLLTRNTDAYDYLRETSAKFPCREEFLDLMKKSGGYSSVRYVPLTFGVAYIYIGIAK